jgi:FkbM family methyltransferase
MGKRRSAKAGGVLNVKRLLMKHVPEAWLQPLKNVYYIFRLRQWREDRKPEFKTFRRFVGQGDTVVDIGANVGLYTVLFSSLVGREGHVYAFEPVHSTFGALRAVVRGLRLRNVTVLQCAVSDRDDAVGIEVPRDEDGVPLYSQARVVAGGASGHNAVHARTLDSMFAERTEGIALVKCDVEGHELACLRGATRVVERFRPPWYMEVTRDKAEIFRLFTQWGYVAFVVDDGELKAADPGTRSMNFLFVPAGNAT